MQGMYKKYYTTTILYYNTVRDKVKSLFNIFTEIIKHYFCSKPDGSQIYKNVVIP
jgi:hypothetical protein